ncbi:MAG: hypothetical protein KY434_10140 [Actinobacteria bacterium]|nr:hypothetical protein [Actinomycetota bacterium]
MTDEEPEPFRMPADPDAEEPATPDDDQPEGDVADEGPRARAESIADLINEAARTAAEQDQAEERGNVPQDRSADVWGEPAEAAPAHGTDAVWQQAEDDAASNVWDLDEDDDMWGSAGAPIHEQPPTDEPTAPPTARTPGADAEGQPDEHDQHDEHDEEPETFTFPAGPDTTAPAALPDHTADEDEEPEAFTFAVTEDQPLGSAQPPGPASGTAAEADQVQEWTVPGADDDEEADVSDEVWTFSVATDQETPLADSASPRDDAGWHDLEAEQEPAWEVSDLTPRAGGPGEEPEAFTAAIQAHEDDEDDDAPWTSPALPDVKHDAPSDHVATAEVQDALGDLLGNGEQDAPAAATPAAATPAAPTPAAATPTPDDVAGDAGLDDFDHLDDLDDLDHLDDMAAAAVPTVGHADPTHPTGEDASTDEEDDVEEVEEEAAEVDQPLDAPTAARQVMAPGAVTFSSSGKKKKRGLFG